MFTGSYLNMRPFLRNLNNRKNSEVPVDPNPPNPLPVFDSSSHLTKLGISRRWNTICTILSRTFTSYRLFEWLNIVTFTSPLKSEIKYEYFLSSNENKSEAAEPEVAILGSCASEDFIKYLISNDMISLLRTIKFLNQKIKN